MKLFIMILFVLSSQVYADEKTYSCVSDTNLKLFKDGDSDELNIVANNWGGEGFYHLERGQFPIFLKETLEKDVYKLDTEGFGGAKDNTEIMLSNEITSLQDKKSIVIAAHPEVGKQVYFCQPIN